jgi:hypothetical protein
MLSAGQYNQALKIALEGFELAEKIGEGIQIPFLLSHAAIGAARSGQGDDALRLAEKGEAESEKMGHPLGQTIIRIAMAEVLLHLGRIEASIVPAQAALAFCRQLDLGHTLQLALQIKIDELMQQASALAQRSESRWYRIDYLLASVRINLKRKKVQIAQESISEAHHLYKELGLKSGTLELQSLVKAAEEMKSKDDG